MPDIVSRSSNIFRFKQFAVANTESAQKVGTDGVIVGAVASAPLPREIWDVGAGTGLIALMLAQRYTEAMITAIELEPIAATECRGNVKASPWHDRITVVEGNINDVAELLKFPDMIVSNPPFFINGGENRDGRRSMARHDGSLSPITLLSLAHKYLAYEGRLVFIAPYDRNDSIIFFSELHRMVPVEVLDVAARDDKEPKRRIWTMMRKEEAPNIKLVSRRIDIRSSSAGFPFTEGYKILTKDFYLDF
ncbi:MAG: methyltransferase [Bacteroides sp.]|nr:methyltransferase [Bacteroides sp.]